MEHWYAKSHFSNTKMILSCFLYLQGNTSKVFFSVLFFVFTKRLQVVYYIGSHV